MRRTNTFNISTCCKVCCMDEFISKCSCNCDMKKHHCACFCYTLLALVLLMTSITISQISINRQNLINKPSELCHCSQICDFEYQQEFKYKCCADQQQQKCRSKQQCKKDRLQKQEGYKIGAIVITCLILLALTIKLILKIKICFIKSNNPLEQTQQLYQNDRNSNNYNVNESTDSNYEPMVSITQQTCQICRKALNIRKQMKSKCCGYLFHKRCLKKWAIKIGHCPRCNSSQMLCKSIK